MERNKQVKVTIEDKGTKRYLHIDSDSFVIGRSAHTDVPIENDLISRQHVRVAIKDQKIWIEDLGSSNGVWLDKKKINSGEKFLLSETGEISLGSKTGPIVRFELNEEDEQVSIPGLPIDARYENREYDTVKKVANGTIPNPQIKVTPSPVKEKLTLVNPAINSRVSQKKVEAEKNIIEQIKNLMNIESDEIKLMALEQAKSITLKAEQGAQVIIQNANQEAENKLEEADRQLSALKNDAFLFEEEARERLENLKFKQIELQDHLSVLTETELAVQRNIAKLQSDINNEQERLDQEKLALINEKKELSQAQKNLEAQNLDLQLEERKIKALIEVETLEAKAKVSQIYSAAEKAQASLDLLTPEVQALKSQKQSLESDFSDIQLQHHRLETDIGRINQELIFSQDKLAATNREYEITRKEIEQNRQAMVLLQDDIYRRDKDSQNNFERIKKEAEDILLNSRTESKKMIDLARESSAKQLQDASLELAKIVADQEKFKSEIDKIKDESARRMAAAHEEASKIIKDGQDKSDRMLSRAKEEADGIRKSANLIFQKKEKESDHIISKATEDAKSIKDGANLYLVEKQKEAEKLIEKAKIDIKKKHTESKEILARLEAKKFDTENQINLLDQGYDERLSLITKESEAILDAARQQADELKVSLEAAIRADYETHNQEMESLRSQTETQRKNLNNQLDLEVKELKQKQLEMLAEQRQVEIASIKELKRKAEYEIQKSKQDKAKQVATDIYAMIASEMYKARNRVIDESFVEPMAVEIKDMVTDIMLDKPSAGSDKLQDLLKIKDKAKGKERKFWKKMGMISGSLVVVCLLLVIFPSLVTIPRDAIISAFTEKSTGQADAYVKMKVEEAKQRMNYNPPTTVEFKSSYVENVLFTTDFELRRQDQAFQDKWILELNDFFINHLDVKDTTIIKFVSLESSLLRDLAKIKSQVDPANTEPKIEEMRQRENEFKDKLGKMFEDEIKVAKYYEFSEKFWNEFYPPVNPSN